MNFFYKESNLKKYIYFFFFGGGGGGGEGGGGQWEARVREFFFKYPRLKWGVAGEGGLVLVNSFN